MNKTIDELLRASYRIIDILPEQVPKDSPGQYFAVEKYYLDPLRLAAVKQKHIDLVLKLNCYRDLSLEEDGPLNPPPEQIAEEMRRGSLSILLEDSMIVSQPDETWLTVYAPDEKLLELLRVLAIGEGLYLWQPPSEEAEGGREDG
ncbi:MAG: hypothetical protein J5633_05975 [Oscillospiraceae bacterium]|nr:hypothetical protein [Oscillospiraceae bacterium]